MHFCGRAMALELVEGPGQGGVCLWRSYRYAGPAAHEEELEGSPSPSIPGSMGSSPRLASSPLVQDSPRPTFSSSYFCQRRKMRRKQRLPGPERR